MKIALEHNLRILIPAFGERKEPILIPILY